SQLGRRSLVGFGELFARAAERVNLISGMLNLIDIPPNLLQKGRDLLQRLTVLALEPVERGEAGFDLVQAGRIGFQTGKVIAESIRRIFERNFSGTDILERRAKRGVDAAELIQAAS